MSTHVEGVIPADKKWKKMKAVWDSCEELGIAPPDEVSVFFEDSDPDDIGKTVSLDYGKHNIAREWSAEGREGLEIDLKDIPGDVKTIRFYNAY